MNSKQQNSPPQKATNKKSIHPPPKKKRTTTSNHFFSSSDLPGVPFFFKRTTFPLIKLYRVFCVSQLFRRSWFWLFSCGLPITSRWVWQWDAWILLQWSCWLVVTTSTPMVVQRLQRIRPGWPSLWQVAVTVSLGVVGFFFAEKFGESFFVWGRKGASFTEGISMDKFFFGGEKGELKAFLTIRHYY